MTPFQFITRVEDSTPLISRGTLGYCIKRLNKKLKAKAETEQELLRHYRLKTIRDELKQLKESL